MENTVSTGPKWTQDEAINYECARECITDLMSIFSSSIADERALALPDEAKIKDLLRLRTSLAHERMALRLKDHVRIAEIRSTYGAQIRAYRAADRRQAA